MIHNIAPLSLDELLDIIMMEEEEPSYEILCKWTKAFPQHSQGLVDFFVTWSEQEEAAEEASLEVETEKSPFASRAVSHALNLLHQERIREQPLALERSLTATAMAAGLTRDALAKAMHLDEVMITKLDKRRFPFESLPRLVLEQLHQLLRVDLKQIDAYLRGPPLAMSTGGRMRSKAKAEKKTETFLEALEKSTLDQSQKDEWRRCALVQDDDLRA